MPYRLGSESENELPSTLSKEFKRLNKL